MDKKKILLIFSPLSIPTSPPLGITMLKGYIERESKEWEVTTFDLNLFCFDYLIDGIQTGEITLLPAAYERIGLTRLGILEAVKQFRTKGKDSFYIDLENYDHFAAGLMIFNDIFNEILMQECDQFEKTGALNGLLEIAIKKIDSFSFDVLGVSSIFSNQLPVSAAIGKYFRKQRVKKVVFGGSCFIEGSENFLRWYPDSTDVIVTGDGEYALKTLLENDFNPKDISGVTYNLNDTAIVTNPPEFRSNINNFGLPDFSDLDLFAYYSPEPVVPLLLSRGCYWRKCTFCVHYFSAGDSYRVRSVDQVIELFQMMVKNGVRLFSIVDEMVPANYFERLSDAIEKAELDIGYYALSKPDRSFTPKILSKMSSSGCRYILWGLESASQRVLDLMQKGTTPDGVAQVIMDSQKANIANHLYLMCGFPTETKEEYAETLAFIKNNAKNIFAIHRGTFSLETGSPIEKEPNKYSITKTWVIQKTPLGARLGYETSSGMNMQQAKEVFTESLPLLKSFNPFSQYLANYRDHALVVYDQKIRLTGLLLDPNISCKR